MTALRRLLLRHRPIALWLVLAALAMKMLVPAGYMVGIVGGSPTIELCSGHGAMSADAPHAGTAVMAMAHHHHDARHGGGEMPSCAFAGLASPALGGADPLLLAGAIAAIIVTTFRIVVAERGAPPPAFLRPQLRGPPAR